MGLFANMSVFYFLSVVFWKSVLVFSNIIYGKVFKYLSIPVDTTSFFVG